MNLPKVKCLECSARGTETYFHGIESHLKEIHRMSVAEYQKKHGSSAPLFSNITWASWQARSPERQGTQHYRGMIQVGKVVLQPFQGNVKEKFKRPPNFTYPQGGKAAQASERIARAFKYKVPSLFIYGPAGAGKSSIVRALAHDLNLECSHYAMREDLSTELYIGSQAVVIDPETGLNVTKFVEGKLLQDLRGRVGEDGVRRGVCLLIDDGDRAPATYHEVFRHILEDNARNLFIPELGINLEIHPDTRIIMTANSAGRGDMTGMYSSVHEMDESILDRFQRVVEAHFLEAEEEKQILKHKFPKLADALPDRDFDRTLNLTKEIRQAIANQEIFASFSHRRLVQWMISAEELLEENDGQYYPTLLKDAAIDWLEWYDEVTREAIKRMLDLQWNG